MTTILFGSIPVALSAAIASRLFAACVLAGQEGFEPPTRGFGDRCSSRSSYWPVMPCAGSRRTFRLLRLLVHHVLAAARAVLGARELLLRLLLVLGRRVVPLPASGALERDDGAIPSHVRPSLLDDLGHD